MNRRAFLATGGTFLAGGIAGCLGDADDNDGYAETSGDTPEERSIETSTYPMSTFDGIEVPLAPIDDVYYWYQRQEARIADARGADQYEAAHITGAVLSTAPPQRVNNDPVDDWPTDDRIVTYCGCPHHLSGLRAAALIDDGYEEVYAIDEGLWEWVNRNYPLSGSEVSNDVESFDIRGRTDPAYAGEMIWVEQLGAKRYEAAPIAADGSYTATLHFRELSDDSLLKVETPDYTVEATLAELTSDVVTG